MAKNFVLNQTIWREWIEREMIERTGVMDGLEFNLKIFCCRNRKLWMRKINNNKFSLRSQDDFSMMMNFVGKKRKIFNQNLLISVVVVVWLGNRNSIQKLASKHRKSLRSLWSPLLDKNDGQAKQSKFSFLVWFVRFFLFLSPWMTVAVVVAGTLAIFFYNTTNKLLGKLCVYQNEKKR